MAAPGEAADVEPGDDPATAAELPSPFELPISAELNGTVVPHPASSNAAAATTNNRFPRQTPVLTPQLPRK